MKELLIATLASVISSLLCSLLVGYFHSKLKAAILESERRILDKLEPQLTEHGIQLENHDTRLGGLEQRRA